MPRFRDCFGVWISFLFAIVLLSACRSASAQAGVSQSPAATAAQAESSPVVELQPTEGPDPVATEYALAALETPARVPTSKW